MAGEHAKSEGGDSATKYFSVLCAAKDVCVASGDGFGGGVAGTMDTTVAGAGTSVATSCGAAASGFDAEAAISSADAGGSSGASNVAWDANESRNRSSVKALGENEVAAFSSLRGLGTGSNRLIGDGLTRNGGG